MTCGEAMQNVFLLLNGRDLASCMRVCKEWRDFARDDYFWKVYCGKHWPSICKRPTPPPVSYYKLFQMFSKGQCHKKFHSPKLSFDDLEFYIDIWYQQLWCDDEENPDNKIFLRTEKEVIFSEVIPGSSVLGGRHKELPPDIHGKLRSNHLEDEDEYKMIIPLNFSIYCEDMEFVTVSVFVGRRDTNKVACIVQRAPVFYISNSANPVFADNHLFFASPFYPFRLPVRAKCYLLSVKDVGREEHDVFAIQFKFYMDKEILEEEDEEGVEDEEDVSVANSEEEVLRLISMLDWT